VDKILDAPKVLHKDGSVGSMNFLLILDVLAPISKNFTRPNWQRVLKSFCKQMA
jgi:hypothetical protein